MVARSVVLAAVTFVAATAAAIVVCARPPAPPSFPAGETTALVPGIAPLDVALTFATTGSPAAPRLLVVVGYAGRVARAIDLTADLPGAPADPFKAIARLGFDRIARIARERETIAVPLAELHGAGAHDRQVATGTNFRDHAAEVAVDAVFRFPKFGAPTPPVTRLRRPAGDLLDYEGELCVRFDRPIASVADFEAAAKGVFLCGDFTDRAILTRAAAGSQAMMGARGFSDAKSGEGFFPTGPFLVVPRDWRGFVAAERFGTEVDGQRRQDARGALMIEDFATLAQAMVSDGGRPLWRYRGTPTPLVDGGVLPRGGSIMSGTPAGVIYRPPDGLEIACGVAAYICLGGWLGERSAIESVVERYIARLVEAGHHLRPGQTVRHVGANLGEIIVAID